MNEENLFYREKNSAHQRPLNSDYKGWHRVSITDKIKEFNYREYVEFIGKCKKYCYVNFEHWWYDTEAILDKETLTLHRGVSFYFKIENDALIFKLKYG